MDDAAATNGAGLRGVVSRAEVTFAAFLTIPDPGLAAILGASGFDFVVIDAEHGPFTPTSIRGCVDALAGTPAKSAIRVAANDRDGIKHTLDLGVEGILVPRVDDGAAAAAAVRACRYSPEGERGVGAGHAATYGANLRTYLAEANGRIAVLLMIESRSGVENAAEIVAVNGVDGVIVGPMDLSADLGQIGQTDHPEVTDSIARVAELGLDAGVKVGIGCRPEEITGFAQRGMTLFACYFDGFAIAAGARDSLARAEAAWERR